MDGWLWAGGSHSGSQSHHKPAIETIHLFPPFCCSVVFVFCEIIVGIQLKFVLTVSIFLNYFNVHFVFILFYLLKMVKMVKNSCVLNLPLPTQPGPL